MKPVPSATCWPDCGWPLASWPLAGLVARMLTTPWPSRLAICSTDSLPERAAMSLDCALGVGAWLAAEVVADELVLWSTAATTAPPRRPAVSATPVRRRADRRRVAVVATGSGEVMHRTDDQGG